MAEYHCDVFARYGKRMDEIVNVLAQSFANNAPGSKTFCEDILSWGWDITDLDVKKLSVKGTDYYTKDVLRKNYIHSLKLTMGNAEKPQVSRFTAEYWVAKCIFWRQLVRLHLIQDDQVRDAQFEECYNYFV